MKKLAVLISGYGSNLEAILNSTVISQKAETIVVISNNKDARGLQIAKKLGIPTVCHIFDKEKYTREEYDIELAQKLKVFSPDLVILAGWMRLLTSHFLDKFPNIINLHPALPGQFPGYKAVEDAYNAFKQKKINHTGIMIHHVVEEMDAGDVIESINVPIFEADTLQDLTDRIKFLEKPLFISSISKVIDFLEPQQTFSGKVRDMTYLGYNLLKINHSDRLSAFDKYVCQVSEKGKILNLTSKFWFEKTKSIIPNHLCYAEDNVMIVKKCVPFKVEVVVRGFITGNTSTSLWTHYSNGEREYCGVTLPEGLVKNQRLESPILTPTTKGEIDEPISPQEIVKKEFMTQYEWNYVRQKALELFKFGQDYSLAKNLILVDTKYEFGLDRLGNILLIDEIHTCDSSRFWLANSYEERFSKGMSPEKFDKDLIRDYIKKNNDNIPPKVLITKVRNSYKSFYEQLTNNQIPQTLSFSNHTTNYFKNYHNELVVIVAGSEKDLKFVEKLKKELKSVDIYSKEYIASAHKQTQATLNLIQKYQRKIGKLRMVWVTVAGRSNALSGVVAANSSYPVIACPPFQDKMDMLTNINSSLQCPSKVPVMTILEPGNVALAIRKMFDTFS